MSRRSPRVVRLPVSQLSDSQVARTLIRRHHWQRYFACVRSGQAELARYHRRLAESVREL